MTLEFRCRNVGVVCNAKIEADSEEELLAKISEHADHTHGVPQLTDTLVNYAKSRVTVSAAEDTEDKSS